MNRKPSSFPYVVVRTAFHGGGVISRHRTREAAERAAARYRRLGATRHYTPSGKLERVEYCGCGCAVVMTAEEFARLPCALDVHDPYTPAR